MLHTTINANIGFSSHVFSKSGSHFIFFLVVDITSMIASPKIQFRAFPDKEQLDIYCIKKRYQRVDYLKVLDAIS